MGDSSGDPRQNRGPSKSTGPPDARDQEDDEPAPVASKLFVYVVPFFAAVFLALGIAGTIAGGWAIVQPAIGGCDKPVIGISSPESTDERIAEDGPVLERLAVEELTPAEQRAIEEAIADPQREGTIEGDHDHLDSFERGVVIEYDGEERYAMLRSESRCLEVDPLALPLGIVSLLVGIGAFVLVTFRNYPQEFIRGLDR